MFIILSKVRNSDDYGFIITRRNLSLGRSYHLPSNDSKTITTYIYQHGFVASPTKELDDLIALGVKLWMENPENIQEELENIIVSILGSFSGGFESIINSDNTFRPFKHLYFNYNQRDWFVENLLNQDRWSRIVERYNITMKEKRLAVNLEILEEESEYLRLLVIRLMTRGIRYALLVYKGNVNLANRLFDMTNFSLQPYIDSGLYNELFILVDKKNQNVSISLQTPKKFVRFNELFINENNHYKG